MIIAVIAMRVMQMSIDQVINMVAVWNSFMTAIWPMLMIGIMPCTTVLWRTFIWVFVTYGKRMLINMFVVLMMKVSIMQVIDMVAMHNRGMAATFTVLMVMVFMVFFSTYSHFFLHN